MIILLTGDNTQLIENHIKVYRETLDPDWFQFNYSFFKECKQFGDAIAVARTIPFGSTSRLTVAHTKDLTDLPTLPNDSTLIVVCEKPLSKSIQLLADEYREYLLPKSWDTSAIAAMVSDLADNAGVKLSQELILFLVQEIGANPNQLEQEIEKIKLTEAYTVEEAKHIIISSNQDAFKIAKLITHNQPQMVLSLLRSLIAKGDYPIQIIAAITSQFRQWLNVKAFGNLSNDAIADILGIKNANQVYFLKKEVSALSTIPLEESLIILHDADCRIKEGDESLERDIIRMCRLFIKRDLDSPTISNKPRPQTPKVVVKAKREIAYPRNLCYRGKNDEGKPAMFVKLDGLDIDKGCDILIPDWKPSKQLKPYADLHKIAFDIETLGLNPQTDRIIAVGCGTQTEDKIFMDADEKKMLTAFISWLSKEKPEVLLTFNGHNFDIPFIVERCRQHGISHNFSASDRQKSISKAKIHGDPVVITEWFLRGCEHIDLWIALIIDDGPKANLTSYGLKNAAIVYGIRDERRLELSHVEINDSWDLGDWEPIKKYLKYDLEDTYKLADKLLPSFYYMGAIVPDYGFQKILVSGNASMWNAVIAPHYDSLPQSDEKIWYPGAYCGVKPGLYFKIGKIDVSSLYPSIMLKYGICSHKDTKQVALAILKYLTVERLILKDKGELGDLEAKQLEESMKRMINSLYGAYGVGGIPFNDMEAAALVTSYGRKILQRMQDVLAECEGVEIETDTDGIYFSGKIGDDNFDTQLTFEKIQAALPEGIIIKLELKAMAMFAPAAKNYILFFDNGKTKIKGVFRKRDRSQLERDFTLEYLKKWLESSAKAEAYYNELRDRIYKRQIDTTYISNRRKIQDNSVALKTLGVAGETVTFFENEYGKKTSDMRDRYSVSHYLKILDEMRSDTLKVIAPEMLKPQSQGVQLSLF